jgi:hypothetical protein
MIVSASYRTDLPAYWGRWFLARLDAGFARVRNPYGGADYQVSLRPEDVDGFVFWTRNAAPFADALAEVGRRGFPFVLQHTVTGYPDALEDAAPDAARAVAGMRRLRHVYGPRAIVWRYDPVIGSTLTPPAWHRENFARLAMALEGATDECTISFMHPYAKSRRGLNAAARTHGFTWRDPDAGEKRALAAELAAIAADRGMRLTICSQPEYDGEGSGAAACIDAARLSDVAGRPIAARRKGNRPGCLCYESRDIGAYDTCPMGCACCYAVSSREAARRAVAAQDAAVPTMGGLRRPAPAAAR